MPVAPSIYLSPDRSRASTHLDVPAMGIHEQMPPGMIRHGGRGTAHPYLLMLFHTPAHLVDAQGTSCPAEGKLIVWDYEALHQYGHPQQNWDHSWLHIAGQWAHQAIGHGDVPLNRLLQVPREELVLRYLYLLYDELHAQKLPDLDMIEGILRLLWHELHRSIVSGVAAGRHDPRLEKARRYLQAHYSEPFALQHIAAEACLSPSHFCCRFSHEYGVSPHEYAMRLRLHRATHLLANPQLAIFQVAQMVGYDDPLYFSRVFRQRYGTSPRQYRQRLHSTPTS